MGEKNRIVRALGIAAVVAGSAGAARAAYIVNGDFESSVGTFSGWSKTSAVVDSPLVIDGSHSAKVPAQTAGFLRPTITDPDGDLTSLVFEADFAATDPGTSALSGTSRGNTSFQVNLRNNTSGVTSGQINLVLAHSAGDTGGTLRAYEQSSNPSAPWQNLFTDAVTFSDASALHAYRLKVVERYTDAAPSYDVYLTDLASGGTTSSVLGITGFQTAAPAGNSTLKQISFESGNLASGAWYVVDDVNVSLVPEPATVGLVAMGVVVTGLRRRRGAR